MVSRRIGFPALPMACLVSRVCTSQSMPILCFTNIHRHPQTTRIVQQLLPMLLSPSSSSSSLDADGYKVSSYFIESMAGFLVKYCGGFLNAAGSLVDVNAVNLIQTVLIRGGTLDKVLQQVIWLSAWMLGITVAVLW